MSGKAGRTSRFDDRDGGMSVILVLAISSLMLSIPLLASYDRGATGGMASTSSTDACSCPAFSRQDGNNSTSNGTVDKMNSSYVNATFTIETDYGTIVGMLYEGLAPITTANFIKLCSESFYDGCTFHRVIDDFVIQGGDPLSKDNNPYNDGTGGSDETIPLEISENLMHIDGAFGMARSSEPDSASSQFYICDGPQHGLDGDYAVFAVTIEGMDVVRQIAQVETWGYVRPLIKDQPREDVIMRSIRVTPGFMNYTENTTAPVSEGEEGGFVSGVADIAIVVLLVLLSGGVCLAAWRRAEARKHAVADVSASSAGANKSA